MLDLSVCTSGDILVFGKKLWALLKESSTCFEQAAQLCVESFYKELGDAEGQPAFALVRLYRLSSYQELLPELQQFASPQPEQWLALMGTVGDEESWCNRRLSKNHQIIPIGAALTPMLKAAFAQLGFQDIAADAPTELLMQEGTASTRYFYVADALGSPHIPAQKDFVKPYGIQSVIGLGAQFSTHNACILLGFSKVPLYTEMAHAIAAVTPYITTPLASFDESHQLWC